MGFSVLLLSRYERKGPSSRVRHYNYVPALEQAGFHVTVAPFLDNEYLDRFFCGERRSPKNLLRAYGRRLRQMSTVWQYDLLWIEKEALPWLPAVLEASLLWGRPLIIDFDDAWHLRYANHRNGLVRAFLGRKLEALVARATAVTAGSPALVEWARSSKGRTVVEMPPAVDMERYQVQAPPNGPFTIGWIGTPPNEAYLTLIAEPLRQLHAKYGARLRLIGGSGRFSLPGVQIDHVTWREDTEAAELARCHVGIMPLPDGPWERYKCGYKLVQYMAAGRCVVASAVGANRSIVVHGQTGFLARNMDDWITALSGLASDPEWTRALGLAGRRRAETEYSLQSTSGRLVETFRAAVGDRQGRRLDQLAREG
jgi:glycosyltransferase involved in cell wall biosynthesis